MGHCFSCFKSQANAEISTSGIPDKKDEVTDISANSSAYPQVEPLLGASENSLNSNMSNLRTLNSFTEQNSGEPFNILKNPVSEKSPKSINTKFSSIPRTISSIGSSDKISETKINLLFNQYKDVSEDAILAEGIENLCNDLHLSPDDFKVLILAWKLNASQMCRFTKSEFMQGLKNLKTDSIKGIQQKLNDLAIEMKRDTEQFKDLYRFTFKFGLDVSIGQRILPSDIAIVLWRLVFTNNEPPILVRWLNYLEKNPHIRGIPKDTWYMFLNFCEFVGDDLSNYDDTEAWPSLFDDFVEYENDQVNQNVTKSDIKIID